MAGLCALQVPGGSIGKGHNQAAGKNRVHLGPARNNEIPGLVFINEVCNRVDLQNVKNRHFYRGLEKAGLRKITFCDWRHAYASRLIQNRESLAYVKEQLGHTSTKMTVDVYGHRSQARIVKPLTGYPR